MLGQLGQLPACWGQASSRSSTAALCKTLGGSPWAQSFLKFFLPAPYPPASPSSALSFLYFFGVPGVVESSATTQFSQTLTRREILPGAAVLVVAERKGGCPAELGHRKQLWWSKCQWGNSGSRMCEPALGVTCRGQSCRLFVLRCSFPRGLSRQTAWYGWQENYWWIHWSFLAGAFHRATVLFLQPAGHKEKISSCFTS